MPTGIGICAFNRPDSLRELVCAIRTFTAMPYILVVVDGGSSDDRCRKWCVDNGVRLITGPNKGIARSKNLALYYFLNHTACEHVILLEDDVRVWERGWEQGWVSASGRWKHVNYWFPYPEGDSCTGRNMPSDPMRTNNFGGHCTITERSTLEKVGYLDPRFGRYGAEHAEWTWRFHRLLKDLWGNPPDTVPCLSIHVGVVWDQKSSFNAVDMQHGDKIWRQLESDASLYRDPWLNDEDKKDFLCSIASIAEPADDFENIAGIRCPLCRSIGTVQGEKEGVVIRNCCGILLSWAWENEKCYYEMYTNGSNYHVVQQIEEGQKPYWDRDIDFQSVAHKRLETIRFVRPDCQTLVDIGAATGSFVKVACERGLRAVGYEPNQAMCETASDLGRPMVNGTWSELDGVYDVITLMDVFEHLTRPRECLERLKQHLKSDGIIYIEMPEAACAQNLKQGLRWKHIRPKQHVALYSESAATNLFKLCGLAVELVFRPLRGSLGKIVFIVKPA